MRETFKNRNAFTAIKSFDSNVWGESKVETLKQRIKENKREERNEFDRICAVVLNSRRGRVAFKFCDL